MHSGGIAMKEMAVVICNWNKKNFVLGCIESVLKSTYRDLDIIVVDNASTDGSAQAIRDSFGHQAEVIENEQNLGGAGGFNTGIRHALAKGYKYIHLLDNDVVIDEKALEVLREELEASGDLGVAGSLIYDMDRPTVVQELGARISWESYHMQLNYAGATDNGDLPERLDCDYVPACSMMIRSEALRVAGIMDEQFFIYWDDVDLCTKVKRAGYRILAYSKSKVWHKRGVVVRTDTFANYYIFRNRIHYFAKYCDEDQFAAFCDKIADEWFKVMYMSAFKGQPSIAKSVFAASEDALHLIRGKAREGRIFQKEALQDRLGELVCKADRIVVIDCEKLDVVNNALRKISSLNPNLPVTLSSRVNPAQDLKARFPGYPVTEYGEQDPLSKGGVVVQTCAHVLDEKDRLSDRVDLYIDAYLHEIHTETDRKRIAYFDSAYEIAKQTQFPVLRTKLSELRAALA